MNDKVKGFVASQVGLLTIIAALWLLLRGPLEHWKSGGGDGYIYAALSLLIITPIAYVWAYLHYSKRNSNIAKGIRMCMIANIVLIAIWIMTL